MNTCIKNQWNHGAMKSASEIKPNRDYRAEFAPMAEKHRQRTVLMAISFLPVFLAALTAWLVPPLKEPMTMLAFLLGIVCFVVSLAIPRLVCPACRQSLTPKFWRFGPHCPTCGGTNLGSRGWLSGPTCGDCGALLAYDRGHKTFTVHACTHCGVWLDDQGV